MCTLEYLQTLGTLDDLADMHEAMDMQDEMAARLEEWRKANPPEKD